MIAEAMAWAGRAVLGRTPPDGKDYWSARFWDRDSAERHPILAPDFKRQKDTLTDYLRTYGADAKRVLEFACGTGEFTRLTAEHTPAAEITALDISAQGLAMTKEKVRHGNLRLVRGDFWADHGLGTADMVLCVDAIHHLGDVSAVLSRLNGFLEPGGVIIGNIVIRDNFHEFGRKRYGVVRHGLQTAMFLGTALLIRLSGGRLNTGSYRTQLRTSEECEEMLHKIFGEVLAVSVDPYFMAFAAKARA